ncbi:MAG TPA: heparan-alpha-glucosaminide N-acetyltransferase domain-containing protein [Gemmataceae bacterium]|nr:heparan-alpha-glucosaminide N-acetyltransferase domain-containing protein [Gemmataceae bacterium]
MSEKPAQAGRIVSLDQFRGYTVLGMLLVNFIGGFAAIGSSMPLLKHHTTYCSYADTIMPQFFFAVGFAYRLTFRRRLEKEGAASAYLHVLRRSLGLILLGLVIYHLDGGVKSWTELKNLDGWNILKAFKRSPFQTLTHIGVTSLWVLPVISARPAVLVAFAFFSGLLHISLSAGLSGWPFYTNWSYYEWVNADPKGIDGGPLGFLSWTIPLVTGSLAYDLVAARRLAPVGRLLIGGTILMLLGYALACLNSSTPPNTADPGLRSWLVEPPFVPPSRPVNMWTMSQRSGSVSYQTFAAGFALALYALFALACDRGRLRLGFFATFGSNALAAYIIHDLVDEAIKPYAPNDAPLWFVLAAFALFLAVCYLFVHHLEKNRIFLRL